MKDQEIEDIVYIIDVSLSMGRSFNDMQPSKLSATLHIMSMIVERILKQKGSRIGIVVFYNKSIPLLPPTDNISQIMKTLSIINKTFEGSAPGDAIIDAVKMLRKSLRKRKIVMITDGDYNAGAPLELATIYAANHRVDVNILTLGVKEKIKIVETLEYLEKNNLLNWYNAETKTEALRNLMKLANLEIHETLI
ncbi:MAG: VWA domain-containing protein [Desulfurococcales archaeon]|nr:VWA domain-containing protein [Desulfurococcales archaeon]